MKIPFLITAFIVTLLHQPTRYVYGQSEQRLPLLQEEMTALISSTPSPLEETSFATFLNTVKRNVHHPKLHEVIEKLKNKRPLDYLESATIARLLGIYTRLAYQNEIIGLLEKMVALPTYRRDDVAPHEHPAIVSFGKLIEEYAAKFNLAYRNVDNRIFEVTLTGSGEETFGIVTHADVVPAIAENWVLDDGTQLHPFRMRIIDGKIYGRGTEDDKASIATSLYAMHAIKLSGLSLKRSIRLMIETTEETGSEGFAYYQSRNNVPEYNIVLDSAYPAVIAEKGFGSIHAYFPLRAEQSEELGAIVRITGGMASNQIPAMSVVSFSSDKPELLYSKLKSASNDYLAKHDDPRLRVNIERQSDGLTLAVYGVSAHSSSPSSGLNPVAHAFNFLHSVNSLLQDNHYKDAISYLHDNFGLDYYGEKLGIGYADEFMGPLTASVTFISHNDENLQITVNVRNPRPKPANELKSDIESKLAQYQNRSKLRFSYAVSVSDWMYRNPSGAWLNTLLTIFGETTGLESKPISSSGSTTAKLLPNAINFGPSLPGQVYRGHTANEYKYVENLLLDSQMFTEMMLRIGNLESME